MSRTKNRYNGSKINWNYYVGIYARVSVDNKDNSINNQIELAKEYIKNNRDLILVDVYIDNGATGKNFCRKGYKKLMEDIDSGRINCIIVKDISRLGRNFIDISRILEFEMVKKNIRVISINENYDSKNERSSFNSMNSINNIVLHNIINEIYIKDISYKIKKSKELLKTNGAYIGVYAPYGYEVKKINGKRVLVIEEATKKIVEKMCDLYKAKNSYTYIRQWLYSQNINTKSDYRKSKKLFATDKSELKMWTVKSIKETIENENRYLL